MLGLSLGLSGAAGLAGGAAEQILVRPGALSTSITFARASVGRRVTAGGVLQEVGANLPRFSGPAQRLLVEGERSNLLRNPTVQGAVIGGATPPTYWSVLGTGGLSRSIEALVTQDGLEGVRIRVYGTASTSNFILAFEASNVIPAVSGKAFGHSVYARLVSGVAPPGLLRVYGRSSGAVMTNSPPTVPVNLTAAVTRFQGVFVMPEDPNTVAVQPALSWALNSGTAYDFTVDLFLPQTEEVSVSTPILPPAGSLVQSSRATDLVTGSMAALFPDRRGTLLLVATLPAVLAGAAPLLTARRGAGIGLFSAYLAADGSGIRLATRDGSGLDEVAVPGAWSAGGELRLGLTFDEARGLLRAVAGGAAASLTPRTAAARGELHVGRTMLAPGGDDAPGFIEVARLVATRTVMAGAEMNARLAAL